jgi:peptide/nickel transport system substrate-binding protein
VIDTHDSGTFWTLGDEKSGDSWKDLQLIYQRFSMNPDPSYATAWFTSDQVGVWNWQRWRSPEFDDLHKKALVERDPAKRDEMYKHMQDLMEDSGAYVFITHEANALIYRNGVAPALKPDGNAILQKFKSA